MLDKSQSLLGENLRIFHRVGMVMTLKVEAVVSGWGSDGEPGIGRDSWCDADGQNDGNRQDTQRRVEMA